MLHRILFDAANMAESSNLGAFLRMGDTGKLASYTTKPEAGNVSFVFVDADVTVGTDTIAEVAHGLVLGDKVQLTTSGTLPAGLALATDYYVIRVSADAFKLASSLANAELGVAVDITAAAGGGNHTVTEMERVHAALDVNVVNPVQTTISGAVTVTATDFDIRDLDAAQDNVAISDGTDTLAINNDGSINITDNGGSLTVDAVDLDIRNLVFATDKVDVSGSEVSLDSATLAALENITVSATDLDIRNLVFATDKVDVTGSSVSITGSVTVTATDLDIRDLTAATDSVESWLNDGAGNAITSTSGALDVNIANAGDINVELTHNTAIHAEAEAVAATAGVLIATPLAARENLWIYNNGSKAVFIGQTGVTTASGFPIYPGSLLEMKLGAAVVPYAISQSGTQDVRVLQAS